MKLRPLYDRVVILPEQVTETTCGIIIPKVSDEKSSIGIVEEVGNGQTFDGNKVAMQVKKGDRIIYSKFAGSSYKIDGKEYLIIRQADILSVIEGE